MLSSCPALDNHWQCASSCYVVLFWWGFQIRCSNEQLDGDGQRHLKRWQRWQKEDEKEKGKEKHRSKEEQKGPGQKGRKQGHKGQETISFRSEPVLGISKRTAKKCCCVLIFSLLSWILTEPKNKRITTNPSAWCVCWIDLFAAIYFPPLILHEHFLGPTWLHTACHMVSHQWILPNVSSNIVPYIWR